MQKRGKVYGRGVAKEIQVNPISRVVEIVLVIFLGAPIIKSHMSICKVAQLLTTVCNVLLMFRVPGKFSVQIRSDNTRANCG